MVSSCLSFEVLVEFSGALQINSTSMLYKLLQVPTLFLVLSVVVHSFMHLFA